MESIIITCCQTAHKWPLNVSYYIECKVENWHYYCTVCQKCLRCQKPLHEGYFTALQTKVFHWKKTFAIESEKKTFAIGILALSIGVYFFKKAH